MRRAEVARERRRRQVVAGGYALRRTANTPDATIVTMGALVPEALKAAERLEALGLAADALCLTSPDLLFRADVDPRLAVPGLPRCARRHREGVTTSTTSCRPSLRFSARAARVAAVRGSTREGQVMARFTTLVSARPG